MRFASKYLQANKIPYEYDAWGNHRVYDASGSENTEDSFIGNINAIRYRGYYYDTETGLYYLQTRYYDSETGRFISPDSGTNIEPTSLGEMGLYAYCGYNPVMNVDPSGEFAISVLLGSIAFSAAYGALVGIRTAYTYGTNIWKGMLAGMLAGIVSGAIFGAGAALGAAPLFGLASATWQTIAALSAIAVGSLGVGMGLYALDSWAYETAYNETDMYIEGAKYAVESMINFGMGYLLGAKGYYHQSAKSSGKNVWQRIKSKVKNMVNSLIEYRYDIIERTYLKQGLLSPTNWLVEKIFDELKGL